MLKKVQVNKFKFEAKRSTTNQLSKVNNVNRLKHFPRNYKPFVNVFKCGLL